MRCAIVSCVLKHNVYTQNSACCRAPLLTRISLMARIPSYSTSSLLDGWGLYIHVPFCARKCPYCDFTVAVLKTRPEIEYIDALLRELDARMREVSGPPRTIYVGGGTPGLLAPENVRRLGEGLRARGMLHALEEFTVEINPEHADDARLAAWKAAGATRLSMGAQALHDDALRILGRQHRPEDVFDAIERAHAGGFEHLSIDFIFAVPGVERAQTLRDVARAAAVPQIDHVSLYELTVEPRTVFGVMRRRGELPPWPDEDVLAHWHALTDTLAEGGFARYEVSNFARPGGRAHHNASYWIGRPYLGIGVSAASFTWKPSADTSRPTQLQRRSNRAQLKGYIDDPLARPTIESLHWADHLAELLPLGIRTVRGVPIDALSHRFDLRLEHVEARLEHWEALGYFVAQNAPEGRVFESRQRAMEIADTIGVDLMTALDQDLQEAGVTV